MESSRAESGVMMAGVNIGGLVAGGISSDRSDGGAQCGFTGPWNVLPIIVPYIPWEVAGPVRGWAVLWRVRRRHWASWRLWIYQ